jgi:hypothetical protein
MSCSNSVSGVGAPADSHGSGLDEGAGGNSSGSGGSAFGDMGDRVDAEGNVKHAMPGSVHGGTGQTDGTAGPSMNVNEVAEAAEAMGVDVAKFTEDFVGDPSNFTQNQSPEQKRVGSVMALNELIAAKNINQLGMSSDEVSKLSGKATEIARGGGSVEERGAQLRSVLEGAGGDLGNMTDAQLVDVWKSSTHATGNHAILTGDAGALSHLRSLNKPDAADGTGGERLAYYNDKQDWPQHGAKEEADQWLQKNQIWFPA